MAEERRREAEEAAAAEEAAKSGKGKGKDAKGKGGKDKGKKGKKAKVEEEAPPPVEEAPQEEAVEEAPKPPPEPPAPPPPPMDPVTFILPSDAKLEFSGDQVPPATAARSPSWDRVSVLSVAPWTFAFFSPRLRWIGVVPCGARTLLRVFGVHGCAAPRAFLKGGLENSKRDGHT